MTNGTAKKGTAKAAPEQTATASVAAPKQVATAPKVERPAKVKKPDR